MVRARRTERVPFATRLVRVVSLMALLCLSAGMALTVAQDFFRNFDDSLRGEQGDPAEIPLPQPPDRNLAGCHMHYTSVRREPNGSGWRTDYPWAQRNLLIRLSELTRTRVSWVTPRVPHVWLVELTDPALYACPYLMASDVGTIGLAPEEAHHLRDYLEKGGFLWVDDFWGTQAWEHWTRELQRVLPPDRYAIEDVGLEDPIFQAGFAARSVPQVPGIGYWRAGGGQTSERGAESAEVHFRAIRDAHGRIIVVMTHNTDISNSFERETEDPGYFQKFSVDGYAVGLNVLLYAMTH
jgi:hypothetical protein